MSAYGAIAKSESLEPLGSTLWPVTPRTADTKARQYLTIHHLTLARALNYSGLLDYLHKVFAEEIERGTTYPQETLQGELYTRQDFEAYFFAADVLLAIIGHDKTTVEDRDGVIETDVQLENARYEREWEECVAGFYYVKPNYPGRSSHICNGGFVVPLAQRGKKYASVLARSYLHYAPKLGYEATVFNLVFVNNYASVRVWEKLDFIKAGRIPRAGRLKRADGQGEEYVDAWVFYKSFKGETATAGAVASA
ncbi:hypothetical protein PUNSTDRAFT_72627 [Punctularia strigosozonata HHB-11173 SS5]|uniref:uncharacterized protein n=1 Tax=Punctularia strigosozonata (strain HHB-11173) TaxID=741275 RepID=UPI0004416E1D|nr:uncharacterized protein PUNSTDRAFT_72627 [Punctularia strigosozonata HHB-11173 SS5]EIN06582.1 hypothetical protein PUNSTDRAFT_72627 [Punctularia strigosozonata HHB-11173 SS5]